jgi:hypothetical protein
MFEITSDDIALLNDEDLRTLVGRLCECEARKLGFSASAVTWGGHQNAVDGGLDVRVALPTGAAIDGFVPCRATGFQVKKEDMPRNKILAEMRPSGVIRSVIKELADQSGAYIIVSSADSTSDVALRNRREAMKEAVKDFPHTSALTLDFYDRTRLATWVREHQALIPWVREKIGKPLAGWRPYGDWAYSPEGANDEYLVDDGLRMQTNTETIGCGLNVLEGIGRLRDLLRCPGKVVRLVGLSGVGKTRLVQALFDDKVGKNSLDPALACYANIADKPDPSPISLASGLIVAHERAILIIDNCPPDSHGRLAELCRSPQSLLSIVTIEYDIREDEPEGTEVFSLEPSSIELIERLVRNRFREISPVDARTVAEFSGGNARIAIALAATVGKNETISGLPDEDLFKRLFEQRHGSNEAILQAAQALSLVYSFEGEDVSETDQAELFRLGALVGKSPKEMFHSVAELRRRELVQARGVWRAVLPHAIANRLAARALQDIPFPEIENRLVNGASGRLLKSFSRRLGYLNASKEARLLVTKWLSPGGLLEELADLNDLGYAILNNIAPIAPSDVLSAFERVLLEPKDCEVVGKCRRYVHLLRSLAYDPVLFEPCIALIVNIAETKEVDKDSDEACKAFASLFSICFSGTHATIDQRLSVIDSLIRSHDPKKRALGVMALKTALQASHFEPGFNFEFGARSRDYGYWPRTSDDLKEWFGKTLSLAETLACSDETSAPEARTAIAERFRGLWAVAAIHGDLERVCRSISTKCCWTEGWIAVRETTFYDSKGFSSEISARLAFLEALLGPRDLVQKVRSVVLSEDVLFVGLNSADDDTTDVTKIIEQVEAVAYSLGKAVAVDQGAITALLPDLIGANSQQMWSFGRGLAEGAEQPRAIWSQLVAHLASTPTNKRNHHVFRGFLNGLQTTNPKLVNALLDSTLEDESLAPWSPILQIAVGIDKKGMTRLMRSLDLGKAWIGIYRNLIAGGVTHKIPTQDFNNLLLRIAAEPGGLEIAIEILCMRLSFDEEWRKSATSDIIDVGCDLMRKLGFAKKRDVSSEHRLGIMAKRCLVGEKGAETVREICHNLKEAVSKSETYPFYQQELLQVLVAAQPVAALEAICGDTAADLKLGVSILDQAGQLRRNAFDAIPEANLLGWCDQHPESRYPAVAAGVTAFQTSGDTGRQEWTSTALKLLDKAPDRVEVLKGFIRQFSPMSWAGSRAAIVETNAKLLDELARYPDPALHEFVDKEKIRLSQAIRAERQNESMLERERDERFE